MRRHRCFLPTEVYFVTIRTVEERFALSPLACPAAWSLAEGRVLDERQRKAMNARGRTCIEDTKALTEKIALFEKGENQEPIEVTIAEFTNSIPNIIGSCLARAIDHFAVQLYGFVWMSNHGHLLLRAPKNNLPEFMTYLNGQIALEVNRFLGRRHQLWARRYSAAQVLDEAMELELLAYILANPQNAGLVESIEDWVGLSSASFLLQNRTEQYLWFHRSAWHEHGRPTNIAPFLSTMTLQQTLLPQLERGQKHELPAKIRELIRQKSNHGPVLRSGLPKHVHKNKSTQVWRRRLANRAFIPTDRSMSSQRSPQPLCHTTRPALRARYEEWHRAFRAAYRESASHYRKGRINIAFPPGSFPPSRYPPARYSLHVDNLPILHPTRYNLEMSAAIGDPRVCEWGH